MSWVGLIGIFLSLLALPVSAVRQTPQRVGLFAILLIVHVAASVVYYFYALSTSADSALYYFDPTGIVELPFGFGTVFVIHLTQAIKSATGGTYLDLFLIFQVFGFWGIVLLMRTLEEVFIELELQQPPITFLMLFVPGLQFWTSAIGKDAGLFFGASVAVWAAMQLRTRYLAFAAAVVVMLLFRPHIALLAVISLAIAITFEGRVRPAVKLLLLGAALIGVVAVASAVETSFQVNVASTESVGDFFARQSEVTVNVEGGSSVTGAPFIIRLLSLLFRPLFIDAEGIFGLIASAENLFMIVMIGTLAFRFRNSVMLARRVFFLRFSIIFALSLILLLSVVYYNVGLGLRQRIMFMPAMLTFFAAVIGVRQARASPTVATLA